ncbi:carbon-nitrogen family protein [Grosmannia clavigera kw1407]|uniref:Carbon-nitrogen family protein n=1 Tax=Grosmannia clavigera (strain kw1407 / UAMH 11150) TaxID=655863 RepID=F0XA33_GROCL|nr:carbon-nitrogen family protein [Grosmannia clavigera kw1407]EFX06044.1 carbon-nitrogen family protein [Grosmannia clavigera kw1407]
MAIAAIGQICSTASMAHNLEQCVSLVHRAAAAGAKVLFLPEASDYVAASPAESLQLAQPVRQSPFVRGLQAAAQQHGIAVHVGVHVPVTVRAATTVTSTVAPTVIDPAAHTKKLLNRAIWIDEAGQLDDDDAAAYDKLHLFDYAGAGLRESAHTQAGTQLRSPRETAIGRVGSLICFDLRFPEVALALGQPGSSSIPHLPAHIIVYPSAFTVPTGRAHWEVLLRARAIESQCYVVAAAQVGRHNERRVSYGRSLAVDPWGRVLCRLGGVVNGEAEDGSEPGDAEDGAVGQLGLVDIDLAAWASIREKMPLVRRTDVYPEITY